MAKSEDKNSGKNTSILNENHMGRYNDIRPEGSRFANGTVKISTASKNTKDNTFGAFNEPNCDIIENQ